MVEIKIGTIAEIIYYNSETAYTVAVIENESELEQFTATGHIPDAGKGRSFKFKGKWKNHPVYGDQFSFEEYEEVMPSTGEGIALFLSSGIISGIGPKIAKSIVEKFGENTLNIIEENPRALLEVEGIGKKKYEGIIESYKSHKLFSDVSIYFNQYGIPSATSLKLFNIYGEDTIAAIEENPYRLIDDVYGIGFLTADKIASKMGFEGDDERRIKAAIIYTLNYYAAEGNTYIPKEKLSEEVCNLIDVMSEEVEASLVQLIFAGNVNFEVLDSQEVVLLDIYYDAERSVASDILRLMDASLSPLDSSIVRGVMNSTGISLGSEQKKAIEEFYKTGIFILTGGPGTGKTTTINIIMKILQESGIKALIAAPTGRAAKRITETSGQEAVTIHRLLEYSFSEAGEKMYFGKNNENPLECDALIIDEASMIDIVLMRHLLKAISSGTRLIIVGDSDQLPSVGPGNVLGDMLESEVVPHIKLDQIFRQAEESMIIVNSHRVNHGEYPYLNEKEGDFFFLKRDRESRILTTILDLSSSRLPSYFTELDSLNDIQVLTPIKKGPIGSKNLNIELQKVLNPESSDKLERKYGDRVFREGDKVMQVKNNYSLAWKDAKTLDEGEGVFNGDIGYIESIDNDMVRMTVVFDGSRYVEYEVMDFDELEHAYAITVHKSQGNEFPIIIMPVTFFPPMLANRNLLYTAISRGKKAVVLVGDERYISMMIENDSIKKRYSGLAVRLKEAVSGQMSLEDKGDKYIF